MLAIARAMAALPERPRRSVLILFVAAEEQGLLGSKYYSLHPTFAPGKIAANINYDGGNFRGRTKDLTYIGYGKSSLDGIVKSLLEKQGRVLVPDQFPDRGFFYRSDQFNFAKIGVPAMYFDRGTDYIGKPAGWGKQQQEEWEEHTYHQPSDEIDDTWVYEGMIEDSQIGFYSAWLVAQADAMPVWNKGDEFEAARLQALKQRPRIEGRSGRHAVESGAYLAKSRGTCKEPQACPVRDDVQLTNRVDAPVVTAAIITAPADTGPPAVAVTSPATGCTCEDFRRNRVCDHVLMAAAVRMVRRMIDIHADPKQPH